MEPSKTSSVRVAAQALKRTGAIYLSVLKRAWFPLLVLHVVFAVASQFFSYALDFVHEQAREDLSLIALIAALELFFSLVWTSAWLLVLSITAAEALKGDDGKPAFGALFILNFNQLVVEQIRVLGSVVWRAPLLIVPAIVRYVRMVFVPFVVIFDPGYHRGEVDVLKRSHALSRGRFWLLAGVSLVSAVLPWLIENSLQGERGPWFWDNPLGVGLGTLLSLFINVATGLYIFAIFAEVSRLQNHGAPDARF